MRPVFTAVTVFSVLNAFVFILSEQETCQQGATLSLSAKRQRADRQEAEVV